MTTDYTELDAAILARIADGSNTFMSIFAREVLDASRKLNGKVSDFRSVDRRLQAMRKAGKIVHDRKTGWRLA